MDIPMFLGAMLVGLLGGYCIKKFDKAVDGRIPYGFEMLGNNFSAGIIGMIHRLIKKVQAAGLAIEVANAAVDTIPRDADVVITHESLAKRFLKLC